MKKSLFFRVLIILLIAGAMSWLGYEMAETPPPKSVRIAGGSVGGIFDALARSYAEAMKNEKIDVSVINSRGGYENLQWLIEGKVDLTFIPGGLSEESSLDLSKIRSLGAVNEEPIFIFYKKGLKIDRVRDLIGKRVDIAPEGSGTRHIAKKILDLNGLDASNTTLLDQTHEEGVKALLEGKIDAMFLLSTADHPRVLALMRNPNISLFSFEDAEAYALRLPFLRMVKLPKGIYELATPLPEKSITLPAVSVLLVARQTLHPALAYLLMRSGERLLFPRTILHEAGTYPSAKWGDIPLHNEALLHFESRVPWIYNTFPYQIAVRLHRIQLWLIPIFPAILLIWKLLLPSLNFRIRRRICKFYEELHRIQNEFRRREVRKTSALSRLQDLERRIMEREIPLMHRQDYQHLIAHLHQVVHEIESTKSESKE